MREDLTEETDAATLTRNSCTQLLKRAHGGDTAAMSDLRRLLNESPDLWNEIGNIAMQARRSWIELAASNNDVVAEALSRKMSALTLELSGPRPTILERLIVGRVVTCWFQLHYFDLLVAQTHSSRQGEYLQRSQERAQRRYLSAIRSLATVRRLQLPTSVQVNIGGQQVNVLDTGAAPQYADDFTGPLSPASGR